MRERNAGSLEEGSTFVCGSSPGGIVVVVVVVVVLVVRAASRGRDWCVARAEEVVTRVARKPPMARTARTMARTPMRLGTGRG